MKSIILLIALFLTVPTLGQTLQLPVLHSHNDYLQQAPFWTAYDAGVVSIEVDVILKNRTLYVAHEEESIKENRTLSSLYLQPLKQLKKEGQSFTRPSGKNLQLLLDIKSEAKQTMAALVKELEQNSELFETKSGNEAVGVIISGNKPKPVHYNSYPSYIKFDATSTDEIHEKTKDRIAMISDNYKNYTVWNGKGRMVESERQVIENLVNKAHKAGLPIRFWGAPESQTAYRKFTNLGIDYFNTDHPHKARTYFSDYEQSVYTLGQEFETYEPVYAPELKNKHPKNIILFIGDGMGPNHLMSAHTANKGKLTITNYQQVGFMMTQAEDNYGTDSAAAGTALATGCKTKNRSIGVNAKGEELETLIDYFAMKGKRTGLVTTDRLAGATPAAFFGHTPERDENEKILEQLMDSPLNYFVGYGYNKLIDAKLSEDFSKKRNVVDGLRKLEILQETEVVNAYSSTTADLAFWTQKAIEELDCEQGFFLMIECAGIDGAGHANKTKQVVDEVLNLDAGVRVATQYADQNNETLIVVTADHETGGMVLPEGNEQDQTIEGRYFSHDHTGGIVPYFVYGPKANLLRGLIDNTDIFPYFVEVAE